MKAFLYELLMNRKTYVAAAGLLGLSVYQVSQGEYVAAAGTAAGALTALGLHVSIPVPPAKG